MRVANLDDQTAETVVLERGTEAWPGAWSPDGRAFVYNAWDYGQDGRGQADDEARSHATAGDREIVPWSDTFVFQPMDWTPDGTGILGAYYNPPLSAATRSGSRCGRRPAAPRQHRRRY